MRTRLKRPLTPWNLLLVFAAIHHLPTSFAVVADIDIFPDIYQQVLTANENVINADSNIKSGLANIKLAITQNLNETVNCMNLLDATTGQACLDKAFEYMEETKTLPSSYLYDDTFVTRKYVNLFTPGMFLKTISKMLFDQSFFYWNEFGFHKSYGEVVFKCAQTICPAKAALIAAEDKKIKEDFANDLYSAFFAPTTKNKVAGRHYSLDWSKYTLAYNGNPKDILTDTYNMWMPAVAESPQVLHDFPSTIIPLDPDETKSWFVGTGLAALYHLHYHYMLGPDGLFNKPKNKDDQQFLGMIKSEKFEIENSPWSNKQGASDGFMEWIAKGRSLTGIKTMAQFQNNFHEQGKNYMLGRNNNYERLLKKLTADTWYKHFWYRQNIYIPYTPLMTDLGYNFKDARVVDPVREFAKTIFSIKTVLTYCEQAYNGNLTLYVAFQFVILGAIALGSCVAVYVLIKSYTLVKCCCQCLGFCQHDDVDKGKKKKSKVAPQPVKKEEGKKEEPPKRPEEPPKQAKTSRPVSAVRPTGSVRPVSGVRPISASISDKIPPVRTPSETRSHLRLRLVEEMDCLKTLHQAELEDLNSKLKELKGIQEYEAILKRNEQKEKGRLAELAELEKQNAPKPSENTCQTDPEPERPKTRELDMQTSDIKQTPPPSMIALEMQTSEIPRPQTGDIEAQTSAVMVEKMPSVMRPETAEIDMQTSYAVQTETSIQIDIAEPRPITANIDMQTSEVRLTTAGTQMLPQSLQKSPARVTRSLRHA